MIHHPKLSSRCSCKNIKVTNLTKTTLQSHLRLWLSHTHARCQIKTSKSIVTLLLILNYCNNTTLEWCLGRVICAIINSRPLRCHSSLFNITTHLIQSYKLIKTTKTTIVSNQSFGFPRYVANVSFTPAPSRSACLHSSSVSSDLAPICLISLRRIESTIMTPFLSAKSSSPALIDIVWPFSCSIWNGSPAFTGTKKGDCPQTLVPLAKI